MLTQYFITIMHQSSTCIFILSKFNLGNKVGFYLHLILLSSSSHAGWSLENVIKMQVQCFSHASDQVQIMLIWLQLYLLTLRQTTTKTQKTFSVEETHNFIEISSDKTWLLKTYHHSLNNSISMVLPFELVKYKI